jgi:predicted acylesterase/phospholipase RssA
MRAMQMGDRQSAVDDAEKEATITVTPDTRGLGLLEFHQLSEAREAGLRAGEAAVTALRQSEFHLSTTGARS